MPDTKTQLLIIDDEPRILSALARMLRLEPLGVVLCDTPMAAIERAKNQPFDIVLSDFRMPGMDGIALMKELAALLPESTRILMSGNADLRTVIESINKGAVHQFIEKPWNDDAVKVSLRRIVSEIQTARQNRLLTSALSEQNLLLTQASERAELEIQRKERLYATISHEIRNPLHGLQGILTVLDKDAEGEQKKLLEAAMSSADYMLQVVNDVLDYSQAEAGQVELSLRPFSPLILIEDLVRLMEPMAASKSLYLNANPKNLTPDDYFLADDFRVRQVVTNLLSNAVKYTNEGGVDLGVESVSDGITFEIRDSGIGIPEDRLDDLFGEFVMIDPDHARTYGGTGLGLKIVKTLVDLMQGHIETTSEVGVGTRFKIFLPMETTDLRSSRERIESSTILQNKVIWVVDDMRANRLVVEHIAKRYGAKVESFESGYALLDHAKGQMDADVILLDYNMPELTGFDILKALRSSFDPLKPQVFAMTASLNFEGAEAIISEFDGLLSKPFNASTFLRTMSQLDARGPSTPLSPETAKAEGEGRGGLAPPTLDAAAFAALRDDMGDEVMLELLQAFSGSLTDAVDRIRPMSIKPAELIEVAHALAPTAELMGFVPFALQAREIDRRRPDPPPALSDLNAETFLVLMEQVLSLVSDQIERVRG